MDTSYLKDHAETRGFMLGRPARAKPTPDGKTLVPSSGDTTLRLWDTEPLRLRSQARRAAECAVTHRPAARVGQLHLRAQAELLSALWTDTPLSM